MQYSRGPGERKKRLGPGLGFAGGSFAPHKIFEFEPISKFFAAASELVTL